MARSKYPIALGKLVQEFNLEVLYGPPEFEEVMIALDDVNRPGLQLAGFFDYFASDRIQVMGKVEHTYLRQFSPEARKKAFGDLFSHKIPVLIITRNIEPYDECVEMARVHKVPLLRTYEVTSAFTTALSAALQVALAPRVTLHGVLVEVYGEGILILGDSGVGKSETAVELVKRGHRLIADDAVEIKRVSAKTLVGFAPELIRYYIELRGIGVIDVRRIFGMGAVKQSERVDLVVKLEQWEEGKAYDRMGLEEERAVIMDISVPQLTIPVQPGRNLAVVLEVAAMNNRQKKLGFNAAQDLSDRVYASMAK